MAGCGRVTLPWGTDALYLFWDRPDIWQLPPERLRDGLVAVGEAMSPALEIVTASHVDHSGPMVMEGDNIVPSLRDYPMMRERVATGQVAMVFLVEPDEDILLGNMLARGRGMETRTAAEHRTEARAKWLFGQWLTAEAERHRLPLLAPRPWETLSERILAAVTR